MTNVDLAHRAGISAPPCLRRVRALEEAGYIRGYHAEIDPHALGFNVTIFAHVGLNSQAEADLRAFESLTGPGGFELAHPAQLVLEVRREDKDAARELATQIELTIADHALRIAEGDAAAAPALEGERAGRKLLGPEDG